jgi:hypothetical protein
VTDDNIETVNLPPKIRHETLAPAYRSHKTVRALEISAVQAIVTAGDGVKTLIFFFDRTVPNYVADAAMTARYQPVCGDFLVFYDNSDGTSYASFSPRKAFLTGYTRVPD